MSTISLLRQVNIINKKNKDILEATGANFNIFNTLCVASDEVRLHSRFIGELLNPKGSHGLKEEFLRVFFEQLVNNTDIKEEYIKKINIKEVKIDIEKYIENGRIDIFIKDNEKNVIVIENKIYAGDQNYQLKRYHDFCKNSKYNYKILYLTLDGKDATENSHQGIEYTQISYKEDIVIWLEQCLNLSSRYLLVRETINQYIVIIKQLIGDSMSNLNKKEIVELLIKKENLEDAFLIEESMLELRKEIVNKYLKPQLEELATDNKLKYSYKNVFARYGSFNFNIESDLKLSIKFKFQSLKQGNMICGLQYPLDEKNNRSIRLKNVNVIDIDNINKIKDHFKNLSLVSSSIKESNW
ncbi:MAG: PD-(D/E)XK nuclease family protein [bacterium]|nr:PD-(D/E)XK nuclease family protein [bacterium]